VFVNALDRVPDQQIQDDRVNPELSPDALKQPTKIMRRNAGSLTTWCLAFPEDPNQRFPQLAIPDVQQSISTFWIDQREEA
jgi:hypothetical protein